VTGRIAVKPDHRFAVSVVSGDDTPKHGESRSVACSSRLHLYAMLERKGDCAHSADFLQFLGEGMQGARPFSVMMTVSANTASGLTSVPFRIKQIDVERKHHAGFEFGRQ